MDQKPRSEDKSAEIPPLPPEATQPPPPPPVPEGEPPPPLEGAKSRQQMWKDCRQNLAIGGGMLGFRLFTGMDDRLDALVDLGITVLGPSLLATWVIEYLQQKWKPYTLDTWRGAARKRFMSIWNNHGGGYYGLVALIYLARMELQEISLDLSDFSFDMGSLIQFLFVDRFLDMAEFGWKAFIWPVTWMGKLGTIAGIGAMLLGYGLFELIRLAAGADVPGEEIADRES
ncbi:MAG: hypothetical protein QNK37_19915 [Acidobacteriota bacterium]|nr:hypothetical protein [Acidobacteriota bacterium]